MIRSLLLSLLALSIAIPAAATTLGEVALSAPSYERAPYSQTTPAIASDGTNFLVVWNDTRTLSGEIFATRVSRGGEILDTTGIRIPTDEGLMAGDAQRYTTALWVGSSYVVLWTHHRHTDFPSVRIARLDADGTVIDPPRILYENAYLSSSRAAATNGFRIVVAYQRRLGVGVPPTAHFALLSRDGARISDITIPQYAPNGHGITLSSNGSGFLAAWSAAAALHYVRLAADGSLIEASPRNLPEISGEPLLATDGRDYVVLTTRRPGDELWAIRFSDEGETVSPLRPVGVRGPVANSGPRFDWTGESYVLVWSDQESVRSVHLDADGRAIGTPETLARSTPGGFVTNAAVAGANGDAFVAWNDGTFSQPAPNSYDVFGVLIRPAASAGSPELLSVSATRQAAPSIAFGGGNYLAVWSENSGIYASRIEIDGRYLDGRGTRLSNTGAGVSEPSVVFLGKHYLVAWTETLGNWPPVLHTSLVDPNDGAVVANSIVNHGFCSSDPVLKVGVNEALLAWGDCQWDGIRATRINTDGQAIDHLPIRISPPRMLTGKPAVAWNGNEWLVAWEEKVARNLPILGPPMYRMNILAARISSNISLLDPQLIPIAVSSDGSSTQNNPAVASDGDEFLVVWDETTYRDLASHVRARHVLGTGVAPTEPQTIATGVGPAATWDGARYMVAWQEKTSSTDILATYIGRSHEPVSMAAIPIATSPTNESDVTLVASAFRSVIAAYTRIAAERFYGGVERVFARSVVIPIRPRGARR